VIHNARRNLGNSDVRSPAALVIMRTIIGSLDPRDVRVAAALQKQARPCADAVWRRARF